MAAVAAMGIVGSANALWWDITGGSYVTGGPGDPQAITGSSFTTPGNGRIFENANDLLAGDQTGGGGQSVTLLTANSVTSLTGSLSGLAVAGAVSVNYFSFAGPGGGYFGVFIQNNSASTYNMFMTAQTSPAFNFGTLGVLEDGAGTLGTVNVNTGVYSNETISLAAGASFFTVMGGFTPGQSVDMDVSRTVQQTGSFDIQYLTWSNNAWAIGGSGAGAEASSLSFATYQIPVPAPMLLAGVGLVGAAVLRRRMTKVA